MKSWVDREVSGQQGEVWLDVTSCAALTVPVHWVCSAGIFFIHSSQAAVELLFLFFYS